MDWYAATDKYHAQTFAHDCRLSSLPQEWQRELAALWRLEADVNNGAYLQFFVNWGRESYAYASQALHQVGALEMAGIVDTCQALVDEHIATERMSADERRALMPNKVINPSGKILKVEGSVLPEAILARIYELSYEFMDYPDDLSQLGSKYYGDFIENDKRAD